MMKIFRQKYAQEVYYTYPNAYLSLTQFYFKVEYPQVPIDIHYFQLNFQGCGDLVYVKNNLV